MMQAIKILDEQMTEAQENKDKFESIIDVPKDDPVNGWDDDEESNQEMYDFYDGQCMALMSLRTKLVEAQSVMAGAG